MSKKRCTLKIIPIILILSVTLLPIVTVSADYTNQEFLDKLPNYNVIDTTCIKIYDGNPVDIATGWVDMLSDIDIHGDPGQWWFYQPFANHLFLPLQRQAISNDCHDCHRLIYTYIEPHTESHYIRLINNNSFFVIQWDKTTGIPYIVFSREIQKIDPYAYPPEVCPFPLYNRVMEKAGDASIADLKIGAPQKMTLEYQVTIGIIILILMEFMVVIYKRMKYR